MMLVSVILPVYNGQRTIRRCLRSIMHQTYPYIEIVVVNDGSKDKSKEIIEEELKSVTNSIIIQKEKNEGIEKARHTGIAVSHGQLIAFIDQDDYFESQSIEKMESAMRMYNADLVQCQSDSFITLFGQFRVYLHKKKKKAIKVIEKKDIQKEILSFYGCGSFNVNVWTKLYKRELIENIKSGGFLYGDDLYLNMQVFPKLSRICVIPDVLYHYERQGTTSKFIPLWLEESKHFYHIKVAMAKEMQSEKALIYSSIELRNCFKVYVESMILFKVDSEEVIKHWINQELQDDIYDMFEWLRNQKQSGQSAISLAIMNKDTDAIYDLCRKSVYEWKWKKIARRILIKLS